jgi:hypothetical protein
MKSFYSIQPQENLDADIAELFLPFLLALAQTMFPFNHNKQVREYFCSFFAFILVVWYW